MDYTHNPANPIGTQLDIIPHWARVHSHRRDAPKMGCWACVQDSRVPGCDTSDGLVSELRTTTWGLSISHILGRNLADIHPACLVDVL